MCSNILLHFNLINSFKQNETSKKWEILCGLCKEILVDKDTLHKRETADESVDFVCNGQLWMVGLIERCAKLLTGRDKSSYLSSSGESIIRNNSK